MNKNAPDIVKLVNTIVDSMTPVVSISSVEVSGTNWILKTCNTYWLSTAFTITIDSVVYTIHEFVQNESLTVSGSVIPTVMEFQIEAPKFEHGASRKVNNERKGETYIDNMYKDAPFVYLPVPRVTNDNDDESSYAYVADIRPIFLMSYDERKDTTKDQQVDIIRPLQAMASMFIDLVNQSIDKFEEPENVEEFQHMNFGDEQAWGNDSLIFDEKLSGVQLSFGLTVFDMDDCNCI